MPRNTANEIRTLAYVLRRTNYGEADRILNLITPTGKMSVMAKGVRKTKSKLAGGIEMFSLVDLNIHQGRGEFGLVTSAKMIKYCSNLLTDLDRMELAALILKKVSNAAESHDNPEYFTIVDQSLTALNNGWDAGLIETWFWFNLAKASGEEVNLYRDVLGEKLQPELKYSWDRMEAALATNPRGVIGADEIKLARLMLTAELGVVARVKNFEKSLPGILEIARAVNKC